MHFPGESIVHVRVKYLKLSAGVIYPRPEAAGLASHDQGHAVSCLTNRRVVLVRAERHLHTYVIREDLWDQFLCTQDVRYVSY